MAGDPAGCAAQEESIAEFAPANRGASRWVSGILIETAAISRFDRIILVWCAESSRWSGLCGAAARKRLDVRARIGRQMPLAEKREVLPISS